MVPHNRPYLSTFARQYIYVQQEMQEMQEMRARISEKFSVFPTLYMFVLPATIEDIGFYAWNIFYLT